ncbi:MAG: hypothetical protein Q9157_004679, partial [Trypethelium eluteriae]
MAGPYALPLRDTTNARDVSLGANNDRSSAGHMSMNLANGEDARPTAEEVVVAVAEKARPPVPLKKAHLDDTLRLRKELDEIRQEKEQAEEIRELMEVDLVEAEDKLQQKDEELHDVKADLTKCEATLTSWKEKAERLTLEIQEEQWHALLEQLNETPAATIATKVEDSHKDEELLKLQDQLRDLTASLAKKRTAKVTEQKATATRHEQEPTNLHGHITQMQANINNKDIEVSEKVRHAIGQDYDPWQEKLASAQLHVANSVKEVEDRVGVQLNHEKEQRLLAEASLTRLREQLQATSAREADLRRQAEEVLQKRTAQFQTQLAEADRHARAQIAELMRRVDDAEAVARSRMEVEVDQEQIAILQQAVQDSRQS